MKQNVNIIVFQCPYKILIHYKSNYCQKPIDEKDGLGNWPKSNLFDSVKVHQL
jgi:hypothetical protein